MLLKRHQGPRKIVDLEASRLSFPEKMKVVDEMMMIIMSMKSAKNNGNFFENS